ncbi:DUF418 domain-containing protein [Halobacillus litoralis]|uniref:DUF418 domain-containing protein n=1 Tax=Halobacillus litoralis TaxID=45668 RepID=UPI001CD2EB90|nr:DUF418 domain-containing protein [Halobacillus litoralis]MCA0969630.1 DUF418 domain-containing protein [Halobacillus litoralis]
MKSSAAPVKESERLDWIDAARGLAILGIFMVNVPAFNAPYFLYGGAGEFWPSSVSQAVQSFIDIFFQASFYTLFSLMFGFGMQMMKERLDDRQVSYRPIIFRRLMVLIGFGLIHAFLIWHGDILLSYGVLGMFLFFFFRAKAKTLVIWGIGMLMMIVVPFTLLLYSVRDMIGNTTNYAAIEQARDNYGNGGITDIWHQNWVDWSYANSPANLPFLALTLIPMFLFGMAVCKKKWLHAPSEHLSAIKTTWIVTGILFLLFKAGPYIVGNPSWMQMMQDNIGGSASAVFYVLSITLLFRTDTGKRLAYPLTWVGRMSLSNYIFQSIVSFILFYSVGFGLYGQVSPLWSFILVIAIYSLQVVLSKLWLSQYKYGPLEWLWRTLTYGKKQPLKRKSTVAS